MLQAEGMAGRTPRNGTMLGTRGKEKGGRCGWRPGWESSNGLAVRAGHLARTNPFNVHSPVRQAPLLLPFYR